MFTQKRDRRERVRTLLQKRNRERVTDKEAERKEDLGPREQREKGIWELRKERKRRIGDRGEGTRDRGFPTSNEE